MIKSPFKFLDSYEKNDRDIFFGRDSEIEKLFTLITQSKLVLVYGQAGTGKSSLINCGLAKKFDESDWFDLYVRRGDNMIASIRNQIRFKAETSIGNDKTIQEGLRSLYLDYFTPVFLVIDQLEELYISGTDSEQGQFIDLIDSIVNSDLDCRIILAMREEYIANLYRFELKIPELLANRLRVEPMSHHNLEEVIQKSSQSFDILIEEPTTNIDLIIENVGGKKTGGVQLPFLQVYLDKLYQGAFHKDCGNIVFDHSLISGLGEIENMLGSFLDEQLSLVDHKLKSNSALKVLTGLITYDGTKKPASYSDIQNSPGVNPGILDKYLDELEKSRIIRTEEERFEVVHDSLAKEIYERLSVEEKAIRKVKRLISDRYRSSLETNVLLTKGELAYISPFEQVLKLNGNESGYLSRSKKSVRIKQLIRISIITLIILSLSLLSAFSLYQMNIARNETQRAEDTLKKFLDEQEKRKDLEVERLLNKTKAFFEAGYIEDAEIIIKEIQSLDNSQATSDRIIELRRININED